MRENFINKKIKFSILTATYNRAKFLKKLYGSLLDNIGEEYEIEWLIMDDGSNDDTEKVCSSFTDRENFKVKYFKQENQGKMQAINNLMRDVSGDFIIECDSDDYFVKNSLKIVVEKCKMLQEDMNNLYAIVFLKNENENHLSGNKFPFEDENTTMFDLYFKYNVIGEKVIVYNASIREKYRYVIENGEKFCTEARLHHQMDLKYNVRCYNCVVIEGEYHNDGYTQNIKKVFLENPMGHYMYFREILQRDMKGVRFNKRIYVIKHYILFSTILNKKMELGGLKSFANKALLIILWIPGYIKSMAEFK